MDQKCGVSEQGLLRTGLVCFVASLAKNMVGIL